MRHDYEPYLCRKSWTPEQLAAAGFFDDGHSPESLSHVLNDQRWITPTHHLKHCGVVLCATGAFSPFHAGHLRMLEIARMEIEERGWKVAGAYVMPDHDGYVSKKAGGAAARPASERIHQARVFLKDHPWIQVDPWAALYQDRPLNYTTILERTQCMLEQLGDYQVVYVFGSDNAGFKDAFHDGEFVCVGRPGHAAPDERALNISSTKVRSETLPRLNRRPNVDLPYVIRLDLQWATERWPSSNTALVGFLQDLTAAFTAVWNVEPLWNTLEGPFIAKGLPHPHISFDRVTGGPHWVSRVFHSCALQDKPASWVSSDLSKIPAGSYTLVDDDIASGSTVAYIKSQTPQVRWTKEVSLLGLTSQPVFDIVDGRDFLFGSRLGGLLVSEGFRVPYITPWVDLASRAKIPPAAQPAFVRAVIEANLRFFEQTKIVTHQTDNLTFWQRLGYSPAHPMSYVCYDLLQWTRSQ